MPSLAEAVTGRATPTTLPKGGEGLTITLDSVAVIAREFAVPGHVVETEALRNGVTPLRYLRNNDAISTADQIRLLESSIAQVGLGGLGGTLLDIFLRTGIGSIRAADGDRFEESNLNRQALSSPETLGIPKAEAAIQRARSINPSIALDVRDIFLDEKTMPGFLSGCDLAIDALGGLKNRLALHRAAADAGIPLVTGALAGWTGYVATVRPGHPGPAEIMGQDNAAEEILGCPAPAVACFAALMATEVVKALTVPSDTDATSLLVVDLNDMTFEKILL